METIWKAGKSVGCELCGEYRSLAFTHVPVEGELVGRIMHVSWQPGKSITLDKLRYLRIPHWTDVNGDVTLGEMICNAAVAEDLIDVFKILFEHHYPIGKMRLVDEYGGDDDASMRDNNSSCFNHRSVQWSGNVLSKHAQGLAVDINPLYNPLVRVRDGLMRVSPAEGLKYADRSVPSLYRIRSGDLVCRTFASHGFRWGGDWSSSKDYQHFEKY